MVFDKWKRMVFPRHVLLGHGVLDKIGELAQDLELGPSGLIVADETTRKVAGDTAAARLATIGHTTRTEVIRGATMQSVEQVKTAARKAKSKYLVGAGGGSVIDVAKLAAHELHLPYISVPTSAAHDGIASANASIKEYQGNVSKPARSPDGIVADTHLIVQAPFRMLASGCGDILANLVAVRDWQLGAKKNKEEYSSFAAALSRTSAEPIMEDPKSIRPNDEESVWTVVKSLISSGVAMSVAGSSRPASGSEHMFSHMLDRLAPGVALHGEQCGVGAILMMKLHDGEWKQIRDALKTIGAPTTAKAMGHKPETILAALQGAHTIRPDRYTILGSKGLDANAAAKLAKETGVL